MACVGAPTHWFYRRTGNEAAKLKLYAEISLLKGDIKSLKEAWGVRGRRRAMDADALTLAARR